MTALVLPVGAWALGCDVAPGWQLRQPEPVSFRYRISLEPAPLITFVNRSCRVQPGHAGQPDTDFRRSVELRG
jgi:hypothetical protein